MALAIIIPTFGRKAALEVTLRALFGVVNPEDRVVVVSCREGDVPEVALPGLVYIIGRKGSSCQRNRGLDFVQGLGRTFTAVLFIDDDVVLAEGFLESLMREHHKFPSVAGFTCHVIADGARTGEIQVDDAQQIAKAWQARHSVDSLVLASVPYVGFSMRGDLVGLVRFDERLAEYGFMEDFDFFVRLRSWGQTAYAASCGLVHLAVGAGRTSQRKFGFSQIMNPLYLAKKGTLPLSDCAKHTLKATAANLLGVIAAHRRQRLIGNLLAWGIFLRKGPCPEIVARI